MIESVRKKTTTFLNSVLMQNRLCKYGTYFASEVSIDWGTKNPKYIDFLQFIPKSTIDVSNIEKGIFVCYEIKSCYEDLYSGHGLNFLGEKNYIVTTMETYKKMLPDFTCSSKLREHIIATNSESEYRINTARSYIGILVPVPNGRKLEDEFNDPTPIDFESSNWELRPIISCFEGSRKRSMAEMLFYMVRSGS